MAIGQAAPTQYVLTLLVPCPLCLNSFPVYVIAQPGGRVSVGEGTPAWYKAAAGCVAKVERRTGDRGPGERRVCPAGDRLQHGRSRIWALRDRYQVRVRAHYVAFFFLCVCCVR
jgi:hypothetical protein